jgi:tRNA dimethylallyltransferase
MPAKQPQILGIVGPTASGKSSVALSVARQCQAEIVSADSRQIYKYLDIGTAKPSLEERRMVKHHFVDVMEPSSEYSAGQFGLEAREIVFDVLKRGKLPILVGGSGLYVKAAVDGLSDGPGKDPEIRMGLEEQLRTEGIEELLKALKIVDPLTLERMKEITPRRVIRALEVYRISGKPMSQVHSDVNVSPAFDTYQIALLWERKELYLRIDQRVEFMIASGLEDEVKNLVARGYDRHLNALNTVGYKEVFDYLDGIHSREEMIRLIKRNSRRFAKRQMTWFRRDERIHWIRVSGNDWIEKTAERIVKIARTRTFDLS